MIEILYGLLAGGVGGFVFAAWRLRGDGSTMDAIRKALRTGGSGEE